MNREQKLFLQILADHLNRETTQSVKEVNWSVIAKYSRSHQVEGIVFYQCKKFMPDPSVYEELFSATVYYYKNREKTLSEIRSIFSEYKIPFFTVKGIETAKHYPVPALRSMGDLDIIVHSEDKIKAEKALTDIGFKHAYHFAGKEEGYSYQGMTYELHHNLVYDETITLKEQKAFFEHCWEYEKDGELDHSFHFLYLLTHLRKHLMNKGAGFRQFVDIAAVGKDDQTLNWTWIEEKLNEIKLDKFAKVCSSFIREWFGIQLPLGDLELDKEFIEKATSEIFTNGVFGFDNVSNKNNDFANQIRKYGNHRLLGRIAVFIKNAFPGYDNLKEGETYYFLNGRPWLLPFAWAYRFFLLFRGKTKRSNSIVRTILISNKEIDERVSLLEKWGLIDS